MAPYPSVGVPENRTKCWAHHQWQNPVNKSTCKACVLFLFFPCFGLGHKNTHTAAHDCYRLNDYFIYSLSAIRARLTHVELSRENSSSNNTRTHTLILAYTYNTKHRSDLILFSYRPHYMPSSSSRVSTGIGRNVNACWYNKFLIYNSF